MYIFCSPPPTHLVIKHHHLATPPTHLFDDVILEWSLKQNSSQQKSAQILGQIWAAEIDKNIFWLHCGCVASFPFWRWHWVQAERLTLLTQIRSFSHPCILVVTNFLKQIITTIFEEIWGLELKSRVNWSTEIL